ncbi:NAD(P)H-dependent oxidoreductase [Streptomyces sp. 891-h]|uniref:NADPH-dependent FMN reductase n=1 Tax=Streptomyces sp. 891-h TaxID=2720714 RepID=UPI001FAA72AA|nr:NAD(P)H-dependent oxidoreductase [Streptomyces sp. 891-h]UNZ20981.1 NAD(P)H-dependent oxidoreductase [Streptomyces sp. 891-h]
MRETTVLAISGSLRADSYNTALLRAAKALAPAGVTLDLYDGLRDIPPYDLDLDSPGNRPAPVRDLRDRITGADAVLIATPEFNYSVPGVLKNALDWVSTDWSGTEGLPLHRKPIAVTGASPAAFGTVRAQLALRQVFLWTDSDLVVKPEVMLFCAHERFDTAGNLTDSTSRRLLGELLDALVDKARTRAPADAVVDTAAAAVA